MSSPPSSKRSRAGSWTGRIIGTLIASALFLAILYGGQGTLPGLGGPSSGVGGAFELVDGDGVTITDKSFGDKLLLVQFGKPRPVVDGAPQGSGWLDPIGAALSRLTPTERSRIAPLFIGIDPNNDRPEAVAAYARAVHPDIIGLGGTQAQIDAALAAYRVQVATEQEADGSPARITGYVANTYLIGPEGRYIAYFKPGADPAEIVSILRTVLGTGSGP